MTERKAKITNKGETAFTFSLGGIATTIPPGKSVVMPVHAGELAIKAHTEALAAAKKSTAPEDRAVIVDVFDMPDASSMFEDNVRLLAENKALKAKIAKAEKAPPPVFDPTAAKS